MCQKVVVLGGSFNPPTIAHLRLMQAGMDAVDACQGVFVPASQAYVARKLKKQHCPQDTLSEAVRVEMLESLCAEDTRLAVSRVQLLDGATGYDYEMLEALQHEAPDAEICFLTGSDKLYALPAWHRIEALIARFNILVARRAGDDIDQIKAVKPFIAAHWDAFTVFNMPGEIARISSSGFRERLRAGDASAREWVTDGVWEILNRNGRVPWNSITDFHAESYTFLSNFYEIPVTFDGLTYGSSEAAFQAQKCLSDAERLPFTTARPSRSKGMGRRVKLRADWEDVKTGIMEAVVRAKFVQHPELAERLLATGDKLLIEGNTRGDTCWGVDLRTGRGENRLGRILMKIRAELREVTASE